MSARGKRRKPETKPGAVDEQAAEPTAGEALAVETETEAEANAGTETAAVAETGDEALAESAQASETSDDGLATSLDSEGDSSDERTARVSQIAPASTGLLEGELSRARLKQALESLVFVSDRIVTAVQLGRAVKARAALVRELMAELIDEYQGRGLELYEAAGGYQFRSAPACAPFVREFVAQKPIRLTRAQLETLALICYRQPITRPEIDDVRGVDSGSAMRVLLERNLIKMIGRKDEAGRPLLYGTTPHFLEFFGMRSLKDLPTLREFTELSDENRALFKRKTGEAVEEAEAALAAEETARLEEEAATHISDEDLAQFAAEADVAEEQLGNADDTTMAEDISAHGSAAAEATGVDPE